MTEESFLALQGDVPELAPAWDALNTLSASSNDPLTLPELEHLQASFAFSRGAASCLPLDSRSREGHDRVGRLLPDRARSRARARCRRRPPCQPRRPASPR